MAKIRLGPEPEPPKKPSRVKAPPPPPTLFEQLLPCSWRGISFPVSSMRVTMSQDLVEHKYWGVDSANVEATGRAPMQIEAVIPFVNGIVPGKGEKWGVLYPTTFRDFLKSFADRTTGILQHLELGEITCKPQSLEFNHDAQRRDGVIVTAHWVETLVEFDDGEVAVGDSPIQAADLAALDLDASQVDLQELVGKQLEALGIELPVYEESFESLVNNLSGVADQAGIFVTLLTNKPKQILYRLQTLQDSVERAKNAITWPVIDSCERLKEAIHDIAGPQVVYGTGPVANNAVNTSRKISRYTTPTRMTMAVIQGSLPVENTMDELIGLNPQLLAQPEVASGTVVRYYA